jgi:hypothetical protein
MLIKKKLDELLHLVQYDSNLLKRIALLQEGFVCKNPDHMLFFGGALTGVHTVRFTDSDRDKFFDTIVGLDSSLIEEALYNLQTTDEAGNKVPVINREHKRGSDVYNLTVIYVLHKLHNSPKLDDNQKHQAKTRMCAMLLYKFLTSLLSHYFKYPADPQIAQYTYEQLSRKFSLKIYGSWGETLWALAEKLTDETSVHLAVLENMDDDHGVEKYINDSQSRVKDMLKNIYAVFARVHSQGNKISSNTTLVEIDGDVVMRDTISSLATYGRYIQRVIPDVNSFIKSELLSVILQLMHTASAKMVISTLELCSLNYLDSKSTDGKKGVSVEALVNGLIEHAVEFLVENRDISHTDIATILQRLRGTYMASRNTEEKTLKIRSDMETLVVMATRSTNQNAISATRTACMLYIVARTLTMRHYASN